MAWERVGAALSLPFAGVHIVEATKQVYRAIPAHRERTRLIPALEPVLVPSSTAAGRWIMSSPAKAETATTVVSCRGPLTTVPNAELRRTGPRFRGDTSEAVVLLTHFPD